MSAVTTARRRWRARGAGLRDVNVNQPTLRPFMAAQSIIA
jgi:hypothetical protein